MEYTEGYFPASDSNHLYTRRWLPDKKPRAVLIISHGLAEHSGRYVNFASYFARRGLVVFSYDFRGHGKSSGHRCRVRRFHDFIEDLTVFIKWVRNDHPNSPIYLVGHSMGGAVTLAYVIDSGDDIAGLILSGTTLILGNTVSPLLISIAGILSITLPTLGITRISTKAISRDPAVVLAYEIDPLVYHGKIPARTGAELIKIMNWINQQLHRIMLPVLIMHGTADRLSNPEGSRQLYELIGSPDKTLLWYPGFYHEIFNEPDHNDLFNDLTDWLDKRIIRFGG